MKKSIKINFIYSILLTLIFSFSNLYIVSAETNNSFKEKDAEIDAYIKKYGGNVSVYYEDLATGESYSYNTNKSYNAASTTKTPLALYVYKLASEGKLNLDEKMQYTSAYYAEGTGVIRYQKKGTYYTLRQLTEYAIVHSDNIAYRMLRAKVGYDNLQKYTNSFGAKHTGDFTCNDIKLHLRELYKFFEDERAKNSKLGDELYGFFTNTVFNDRIPAGLKGIPVAHKIGSLPADVLYHDSAIVYDENPYILIIMSKGVSYSKHTTLFPDITKKIHERHKLFYSLQSDEISVNGKVMPKEFSLLTTDKKGVFLKPLMDELKVFSAWVGEESEYQINFFGKLLKLNTKDNVIYQSSLGNKAYSGYKFFTENGKIAVSFDTLDKCFGMKIANIPADIKNGIYKSKVEITFSQTIEDYYANKSPIIVFDGIPVQSDGSHYDLASNKFFVSLREISDFYRIPYSYDSTSNCVDLSQGSDLITIDLNSKRIAVNGELKSYEVKIKNSSTLIESEFYRDFFFLDIYEKRPDYKSDYLELVVSHALLLMS